MRAISLLSTLSLICLASIAYGEISEETLEKLRPLSERLTFASEHKDWAGIYDCACEIYVLLPNAEWIGTAIHANTRAIAWPDGSRKRTSVISEKWLHRTANCPKPTDGSEGSTHYEYGILRLFLACHLGNAEEDYDAALLVIKEAREHLRIAKAKNPKDYKQLEGVFAGEAGIAKNEKLIQQNLTAKRVSKVVQWFRDTMPQADQKKLASARDEEQPAQRADSKPPQKAPVSKTFTVKSDAKANQTADEAGASGEGSITVQGAEGTFVVHYWYDFPSAYLISAGRGKTLEGKSVTIQFDGEKASYVSCQSGSGNCKIKSYSRQ